MKNSVIKTITLLLIAVMLITAFAACNKPDVPVDNSPAPTEQQAEAPTEEPTAEPVVTEEPTTEPTEQPTPEPTAVPTEAPLPDDPEDIGDCIKDAEVLLFVPFGDDDECAGYDYARDGGATEDSGPQSFCIADGKIYLLDTVKNRVIVSDNGVINYIDLSKDSEFRYMPSIYVIDNKIYVVIYEIEANIVVFDMSGNEEERIAVPAGVEANSGIYYMTEIDGSLALVDYELITWKLVDGGFEKISTINVDKPAEPEMTIRQEDLVITIYAGEDTHPGLFMIRDGRVYTKVIVYDSTRPGSGWEMCYRVYDYEGKHIGTTAVDRRNARLYYPDCPLFVDTDGTLYVMCWMQDGVYITKPNLRMTYTSHLGESAESGN